PDMIVPPGTVIVYRLPAWAAYCTLASWIAARSVHLPFAARHTPSPRLLSMASLWSFTANVRLAGADCAGDKPAHRATNETAMPTSQRIFFITYPFCRFRVERSATRP